MYERRLIVVIFITLSFIFFISQKSIAGCKKKCNYQRHTCVKHAKSDANQIKHSCILAGISRRVCNGMRKTILTDVRLTCSTAFKNCKSNCTGQFGDSTTTTTLPSGEDICCTDPSSIVCDGPLPTPPFDCHYGEWTIEWFADPEYVSFWGLAQDHGVEHGARVGGTTPMCDLIPNGYFLPNGEQTRGQCWDFHVAMSSNCCDTNGFELYYDCSITRPFIGKSPWDGSVGLASSGRYFLYDGGAAFLKTVPYFYIPIRPDLVVAGGDDYFSPTLYGCLWRDCGPTIVGFQEHGCPATLPWFSVTYDDMMNFVHGVFDFSAIDVDGGHLIAHITGKFGCGLKFDPRAQPYLCGYVDERGESPPSPGVCAGACLYDGYVCSSAPEPDRGCFCAKAPLTNCALPPDFCGYGSPNCTP